MDLWRRVKLAVSGGKVVRLQYMSDLHLEAFDLYDSFEIPRVAPILLLAGDVGRLGSYDKLLRFFQRQCNVFERVLYVLGNHEHYGLTRQRCLELAKQLEEESSLMGRLTLLDRTRVDLDDGITLLGCTLWSHVPDQSKDVVSTKISDFKGHISGWTVDDHNCEHERDLSWLQSEIEQLAKETPRRSVVVATHHAPSIPGTSSERDCNNAWSSAFATELIDGSIQQWEGHQMISHWIFGHTHHCCQYMRQGVKVLANQHGYFPVDRSSTSSLIARSKVLKFNVRAYITMYSAR